MKIAPSNNPGSEGRKFAMAAAISALASLILWPVAILAIAFGIRAVLLLQRAGSSRMLLALAIISVLAGIWAIVA